MLPRPYVRLADVNDFGLTIGLECCQSPLGCTARTFNL